MSGVRLNRQILFIFIVIALGTMLLCACTSSGRSGFGPYDFTDYDSLYAREEIREGRMILTEEAEYENWRADQVPTDSPYEFLDPPEEYYSDQQPESGGQIP